MCLHRCFYFFVSVFYFCEFIYMVRVSVEPPHFLFPFLLAPPVCVPPNWMVVSPQGAGYDSTSSKAIDVSAYFSNMQYTVCTYATM